MSWYTVDREVETTMGQGCQRQIDGKWHRAPAMRTLRFRVQPKDIVVGAYGLCEDCADYARSGNLVAFSRGIEAEYVR